NVAACQSDRIALRVAAGISATEIRGIKDVSIHIELCDKSCSLSQLGALVMKVLLCPIYREEVRGVGESRHIHVRGCIRCDPKNLIGLASAEIQREGEIRVEDKRALPVI